MNRFASTLTVAVTSFSTWGVFAQEPPAVPAIPAPIASTVVGAQPPRVLNGGDIVTVTGSNVPALFSDGVIAGLPKSILVQNGGVTATNLNGTAASVVQVFNGGFIDLGTGTIVRASGFGSAAGIIGATGLYARTVSAGGIIPTILAHDLIVTVTSDKPYGVYAQSGGKIALAGLSSVATSSNGAEGWGLVAAASGQLQAEHVKIDMTGIAGVFGGQQIAVGAFSGGQATISGSADVTATGRIVFGYVATGANSLITANNINGTIISTNGDAQGVAALNGGAVNVPGSVSLSVTSPTAALGLRTSGGGVISFLGSSSIRVTAPTAVGLQTDGGGTINLSNGTVESSGTSDATAIHMQATAAGLVGTVNVSGSTLISNGDGIEAYGGTNVVNLTNSTLSNGTGYAIHVAPNGAVTTTLDATLDNSQITGQAINSATTVANVVMRNNALWTMTGNSNLSSLTNNASAISFAPPIGDPALPASYKTLTLQNYVGANGTIGLNTFLGDDASPSDRLVVTGGRVTGATRLSISNTIGLGALTTGNGILLVDAAGGPLTGGFSLANAVAAGPYEYRLERRDIGCTGPASCQAQWSLVSTYSPFPPPDPEQPAVPDPEQPARPDPEQPTSPVHPSLPNYRREVSLDAALPAMALILGRTLVDSLHERVGERYPMALPSVTEERTILCPDGRRTCTTSLPVPPTDFQSLPPFGWARVIGSRGKVDGGGAGIFSHGPTFRFDLYGLQAGMDLYRAHHLDGSRDYAGLYAAIGRIKGDVRNFDRTKAGTDTIDGYSIGAYWTRFGPSGWYLDGVVQGTWLNAEAESGRAFRLDSRGVGFSASLEGGYPFSLGSGWALEPQAQIVYQTASLHSRYDGAAHIRFSDVDSLAGRFGVRIAKTWSHEQLSPKSSLITAWAKASIWNEFLGSPKTLFSSSSGEIPFRSDLGGAWGELRAGAEAQIRQNLSIFATAGYSFRFQDQTRSFSGRAGAKFTW